MFGYAFNGTSIPNLPTSNRGFYVTNLKVGEYELRSPIINSPAFSGVHSTSFGSEFFNKIHLLPRKIPSGVIVGEVIYNIDVFNTHEHEQTVNSLGIVGDSEGVLVGGISEGSEIIGFDAKKFVVKLLPEGPAFFRFKVRMLANRSEEYYITGYGQDEFIEGYRALEWQYQINYSNPVIESYEYRTDIIESWDGSEQRLSLLETPNHSLFNNYTIDSDYWLDAKSKLHGWQGKAFLVSNHNVHYFTEKVLKGSTTVEVPGKRFSDNGFVRISSDAGEEVLKIEERTEDFLRLSQPVAMNHDFAQLTYANLYYMTDNVKVDYVAPNVVDAQVEFIADEESYEVNIDNQIDDFVFYKELPVFDFSHNSAEQAEETFGYRNIGLQPSVSLKERRSRAHGSNVKLTFDLAGHAEIDRFKRFAHVVKGTAQDFWLPDINESMYKRRNLYNANNQIAIIPQGLGMLVSDYNRHVRIEADGEVYLREIVQVVSTDDEEVIVLDSDLPGDAQLGITSLKFMHRARFNKDTFDFEYHHDAYARISKSFFMISAHQAP